MTNPNPEIPAEETVVDTPVEPQPQDNRRRLRELLAVPERDRSDAQWDEIIELEIQLAPGNRLSANESPGQAPRHGMQGKGGGGAAGQQQKKHNRPPRAKNNRRPPRQNKPGGGGTPA